MNKVIAAVFVLLLLTQCKRGLRENIQQSDISTKPEQTYTPRWSTSFRIDYYSDHKEIVYLNNEHEIAYRYILLKDQIEKTNRQNNDSPCTHISPPKSVVTTSSTYIAVLNALGLLDYLKGVNEAPFICNKIVQQKIRKGEITDLGGNEYFDLEKLIQLKPDIIFQSAYQSEGSVLQKKIRATGIPIVLVRDYDEQHPLARAEWMVYISAFFNAERSADSLFRVAETSYLHLRNQVHAMSRQRPLVFFNLPWNDVWYMPGKEAYMTQLIQDAGARHPWQNEERTNSLNLSLDFERVYAQAARADYWLHPNSAESKAEMVSALPKAKLFSAFLKGNVYNNNRVRTAAGGNDFWENGVLFPHLLLKDLVSIFHPSITGNYQPEYYQQINQ